MRIKGSYVPASAGIRASDRTFADRIRLSEQSGRERKTTMGHEGAAKKRLAET
jgi:hypothetical protein